MDAAEGTGLRVTGKLVRRDQGSAVVDKCSEREDVSLESNSGKSEIAIEVFCIRL